MKLLTNILASFIVAAMVAGAMAAADAPTWAWLGSFLTVYLLVLPPARYGKRA